MKRSAPLVRKAPISRGTSQLKRTAMKKRAPKKRPGHDKRMLDACRGQHCYLIVPGVCCGDTATVVPCHANWSEYGKGAGIKAADKFTVPGCWRCHAWLDAGQATGEEKRATWEAGYKLWSAYREKNLGLAA
ncbi:hypothetical protein F1_00026 [Ralstonia phage Heva]|uniref:DUF1364 domain-containing protein n=1 Tax=Ralstonia phage Heva TaxID=2759730 RepID=A0A7G5BAR6_9CAUD|nr:HNH endonuclease [Ralstonia phage Heva]QMV33389.1 hypothetical protein F1_00026 [Ralstonia phage Heva]